MKHDYRFQGRRIKRTRERAEQAEAHSYKEEIAQELTAPLSAGRLSEVNAEAEEESKTFSAVIGVVAVLFAFVSFFFFPFIMGLTSIALGVFAYFQGSQTAGFTAAVLGLVAFLMAIMFI
ncbi:hypothetical protein [Paenibacillus aquistagni]|uniref:Uncharacterized protein n=1 Tax=Paenibacillus aquistagni TaxID=1852522 RepID=A0A1X7IE07_9BACL|nr:hypothetical protein [Paenibacillus aquistagni]SMG12938.1 hypothetical protein SAMN06295960_0362 [Paenibacillus aquistagni]